FHVDTVMFFRTQVSFPQRVFFCRAKSVLDIFLSYTNNHLCIDGSFSLRVVPPNLLAAEKEEAKAVLTLFLKKQGCSNAVASRTINKSDLFVDHLISRLHSVHKSRYLVGRELTTLEIRDALNPYLDALLEEYGDIVVELVENFPNSPVKESSDENLQPATVKETPATVKETPVAPLSSSNTTIDSKKLKALARVSDNSPAGKLPPHIVYLVDLGMELELIKEVIRKFPAFAYYSLEGKIRPVVEFLLDLGVPKSDIPTILGKRPQLCGISLSENLIPTMAFLEDLGVDKKQWAKVIYRFPPLLTYSRQKLTTTVDFLYEMGLSAENVGKILTRCPTIISYGVEDKLRPTAEYFCSLGVDVSVLLSRSPQTFGLSIEANLKPVTEFFLERGYSLADVGTMISRYGALYTFSLAENLIPKWEFFLTMTYPKSELVKFPQYFGYSLEERIKPRYAVVRESGVRLLLNQVLSLSDTEFDKVLKRKLEKMLDN
ncbi:hypothetical protein RJ639_044035, partial [Escallonia herrerae]